MEFVGTAAAAAVGGTAAKSNDDCYFYYYSSCSKGNACPFRHEPAALAQETVCQYWKRGNCTKPHCMYR